MTTAGQNTQQLILNAASQLTAEQFETYQRLCKRLLHGPSFQLLLVDCRDERLQQQLQQLLSEVCQQANLAVTSLKTDEQLADVFVLQQQLITLSSNYSVIQLTGAASWFATAGRWADLNLLRENIASKAPCRLLFWLNEETIAAMIEQAPDWWAWRSGVYTIDAESQFSSTRPTSQLFSLEQRFQHKGQAARRIATLTNWLKSPDALDPELSAPIWFELSFLYEQLGEWDRALRMYQNECLPRFQQLEDSRHEAMIFGKIVELLILKGQLPEAQKIIEQHELPIYQKLGNLREIALTQGKIGDILFRRGDLDQALQIWLEQVLPILSKLGDIREVAIFKGKIVDVLLTRGLFDEALQLLKEAIPALQRSGDIRSVAINQGKIAEIQLHRGELDAAMTTVKMYELPVYQKLGDSHSEALAKASIADILARQGRYIEAIRMLQEEALPEIHKLGDVQSEAAIQSKIADLLYESGQMGQALELYESEILPAVIKLQNPHNIQHTRTKIAEIQQALSKL
jgi:tetratricopeptide (TPR) repeat protein